MFLYIWSSLNFLCFTKLAIISVFNTHYSCKQIYQLKILLNLIQNTSNLYSVHVYASIYSLYIKYIHLTIYIQLLDFWPPPDLSSKLYIPRIVVLYVFVSLQFIHLTHLSHYSSFIFHLLIRYLIHTWSVPTLQTPNHSRSFLSFDIFFILISSCSHYQPLSSPHSLLSSLP